MQLYHKMVSAGAILEHRKSIALPCPLSGKTLSFDQVPCPLYQQRIYGEGLAVEPAGFQLFTPFDGVIESFPATRHVLTMRARNGLKLRFQFGTDGESLMGEGFKSEINAGDNVKAGQLVLEFDPRLLKNKLAFSACLISVLNSERVRGIRPGSGHLRAMEDQLMTLYI